MYAIDFEGAQAAAKWLLADCARDERTRRAFAHEGQLLSRCRSSRLPRLLAQETVDDRPLLIMSWVDGEPVSIHAGWSVASAVSIARGVLDALSYVHALRDGERSLSAVHRDVCPANILVDVRRHATLIDLGLASSALFERSADALSEGTLGYHAPEMFTGASAVDARSDVFCAAIVLWELIAGEHLFPRSKFAAANAIVGEDARDLRAVRKGIDPALAAVVAKALSRDPAQRYATAREFSAALLKFAV